MQPDARRVQLKTLAVRRFRLCEATFRTKRSSDCEKVPRIERVIRHGSLGQFKRLIKSIKAQSQVRFPPQRISIARVDFERTVVLNLGRVPVEVESEENLGYREMAIREFRIEPERLLRGLVRFRSSLSIGPRKALTVLIYKNVGERRPRGCELGIQGDRLPQIFDCRDVVRVRRAPCRNRSRLEIERIGLGARGRRCPRRLALEQRDPERLDHGIRDLILDLKDIVQLSIKRFGPDVVAVIRPDELRGDS